MISAILCGIAMQDMRRYAHRRTHVHAVDSISPTAFTHAVERGLVSTYLTAMESTMGIGCNHPECEHNQGPWGWQKCLWNHSDSRRAEWCYYQYQSYLKAFKQWRN